MHILTTLTYYRPHYSGLTIYAERLARALVHRGHRVTVLTSRYASSLAPFEDMEGVEIVRVPVAARVSKGVIMPAMPAWAWKLARQADVVNLHLPQLDAAYISLIGRVLSRPVVLTYHCDLVLPRGAIHYVANQVSHLANHIAAKSANKIVTNTQDYAEKSPFLSHYLQKLHVIPPPVELPKVTHLDLDNFRVKAGLQPGQRVIGLAARLATEKGVEYLVQAMPAVLEHYPSARVLFVGQYRDVFGEEAYAKRLAPLIARLGEHWVFLGVLSSEELAAFYQQVDVLVLPSINSTESFGMVQVEAMTCGTPVVVTDLPGVRQPVAMTGMGMIIPPADSGELARAIIEVLESPEKFRRDPKSVAQRFSSATIASEYEEVFQQVVGLG
jgi:glycosyltransferase involved in cell wall biosynthesis